MAPTPQTVVTITITGASPADPAVTVQQDATQSTLARRDQLLRGLMRRPPQRNAARGTGDAR